MTAAIVNITALIFIAGMLAAAMLIAWHSFGRPPHALVWAVAFGVTTFGSIAHLAMLFYAGDNDDDNVLLAGLDGLFSALIAVGFVGRARPLSTVRPLLLAAAAAVVGIATVTSMIPNDGIRDATWLLFGGVMLAIGASKVGTSPKMASLPERATALMLVLFALIHLGMAAGAVGQGASGDGEGAALYRNMLALLHPLAFIGIGLFAAFLVAADLAGKMLSLSAWDVLTGVYNRRGFEDAAERAIRNAQRQRQPLSVVVADVDNLKAVNARLGHGTGDRALRYFASRLERLIRRGDLIGRIGGEKFALLLVNARAEAAIEVVERIRRDIAAMPIEGPVRIELAASFGVAGLRPGDISLAALLSRADRARSRSKLDGPDRATGSEALVEASSSRRPGAGSAP